MARPINANAEETRRRILAAASALFAESGFDGTSVRQIASSAGVSLGMIRHYFGSKEGLYRACIESAYIIYDRLRQEIQEGLADGGDPVEVMAQSVRAGFRFALDNQATCRLVLWMQLEQGSWRIEQNDEHMLPFVVETSKMIAPRLSRDFAEVALALRSIVFLVTRYATADAGEMAVILSGGDPSAEPDDDTLRALEEHLVALTRRALR